MVKKVYRVENLTAPTAHRRWKRRLMPSRRCRKRYLPATMQLRITAEDPDALLPQIAGGRSEGGAGRWNSTPETALTPTTATPANMSIIMIAAAVTSIITTTITNMSIATTTLMTIITMMTMSTNTNTITTMNIPTSQHDNGHEHGGEESEDLKPILVGAVLFVVGLVLDHFGLKWPTLGVPRGICPAGQGKSL